MLTPSANGHAQAASELITEQLHIKAFLFLVRSFSNKRQRKRNTKCVGMKLWKKRRRKAEEVEEEYEKAAAMINKQRRL